MSKFNGSVQISKDLYFKLITREHELELLERAGVDNWDGVGEVDWEELDELKQVLTKALHEAPSLLFK